MSGLLLPLVCPGCGRDAQGSGASKVYVCPSCRTARFMDRPERTYPVVYLAGKEAEARRLYAPFWRVTGTASWRIGDPGKARAYGNARPLGALHFPAFWTARSSHDENLTLRYALLDVPPSEDEAAAAPLLPGILDPEHLTEMARLTWLMYLDRVADVTGADLQFLSRDVAYVAVPFSARGQIWEDGVLGLRFPQSFFGRSTV